MEEIIKKLLKQYPYLEHDENFKLMTDKMKKLDGFARRWYFCKHQETCPNFSPKGD